MSNLKLVLTCSLIFFLTVQGLGVAADENNEMTVMDKIKKYGLYNIMATYTTYFSIQEVNRARNIKVGARALNGKVIKPGEVFSFNQVVGPRTKDRGYKEAPEIINRQITEGVGGGVCQLSSTLYNTVLLADLKVIERVHHSQPVGYVDLGRGATVYYNQIDFKFRNTTRFPVLIMSRVTDNRVTVSLLGRENRLQVKIVTSNVEVLEPKIKRKIDKGLPPGERKVIEEGQKGYRVLIKKIVKKEGIVVNKEVVSEDIYSPKAQIIKVNPKE